MAIDANRDFASGLAVTLHSSLRHLSAVEAVGIYVFDAGLSPRSWDRLRRVVTKGAGAAVLQRIEVDYERFQRLAFSPPESVQFPPAVYARLLVADLLPPSIERVLYLDCDLLVHRDLAPLFETDLQGAPVGAAQDLGILTTDHPWSGVPDGIESRPYFNSGVLLIDLARWRSEGIGERVLAYAATQPTLRWPDQDALNAVIERWHRLDQRWNVQVGMIKQATTPAPQPTGLRPQLASGGGLRLTRAISHFSGGKPWDPVCNSPDVSTWVVALVRSGWYSPTEMALWLARWAAVRAVVGGTAKVRRMARVRAARRRQA